MLLAAGVYNLVWGITVVLWPNLFFEWAGATPPNYPQLWQCIGMIVGVYGIGYIIAAFDVVRHWPIVLVGFLGKFLGPIGFVQMAMQHIWPWKMGWVNVFNDLIWLVPFTLILLHAYRVETRKDRSRVT